MTLNYKTNWLPHGSSLRRRFLFGFIKKLPVLIASLTLILFAHPTNWLVLAQTAPTVIEINDWRPVIGIIGGHQTSFPVQLNNFSDPDGLAAFSFILKYDPLFLPIADANADGKADSGQVTVGAFLGSSGKQVACSDGYIDKDATDSTKKQLTFSCVTLGPTPAGPTGSGDLATINFTTGNTININGLLRLTTTELVDNTEYANLISHTAYSSIIHITKCADFDGNKFVNIFDILFLAGKFGFSSSSPNWNPGYDFDGNNFVNVFDLLIAAKEFGMTCP